VKCRKLWRTLRRRINKKWAKRYGFDRKVIPCMYIMSGVLVAHPEYKSEFEALDKAAKPFEATLEVVPESSISNFRKIFTLADLLCSNRSVFRIDVS